ncbi:hypothetical protein B0H19DRAFT_1277129 [Mycena capillaripes]|nr:hypothetical protein B0H19DRAFT_1277129 [Mycena capillaripes]
MSASGISSESASILGACTTLAIVELLCLSDSNVVVSDGRVCLPLVVGDRERLGLGVPWGVRTAAMLLAPPAMLIVVRVDVNTPPKRTGSEKREE